MHSDRIWVDCRRELKEEFLHWTTVRKNLEALETRSLTHLIVSWITLKQYGLDRIAIGGKDFIGYSSDGSVGVAMTHLKIPSLLLTCYYWTASDTDHLLDHTSVFVYDPIVWIISSFHRIYEWMISPSSTVLVENPMLIPPFDVIPPSSISMRLSTRNEWVQ